jgi:hypothetical protein
MRYVLLIMILVFNSCSPQRMMETNLYFGQSKPSGEMVTEAEWNGFKENYISKVFKEGSTIVSVTGNWLDPDSRKLITEPTYKVIYFYKRSPAISRQIDSLRHWYKTLFQQQSVLRVDRKVHASF